MSTKQNNKGSEVTNVNESKKVIASVPLKKANDYKQGQAKNEAKKASKYKKRVLDPNNELKKERLKLGYCIDDLLKLKTLEASFGTLLRKAKKDSVTYKKIELEVRKSKKGYTAFYLLQYLNKVCK